MNFNMFRKMICKEMEEKLGSDYEIVIQDVDKINNTKHKGIVIRRKDCNVAPVIYLEDLYNEYVASNITLAETIEYIYDIFKNARKEQEKIQDMEWLQEWEKVKPFVRARLINTARNQELLKDAPHKDILNLSVVFAIRIDMGNDISGSTIISNKLLKTYGIDENTLFEQAISNIKQDGICFVKLKDLLRGYLDEAEQNVNCDMYILSNKNSEYGATMILLKVVRDMILDFFKEEVYVIPSSVHEMLLLPKSIFPKDRSVNEMVKEVNVLELEPNEVLADNAYMLDMAGRLQIVE